MNNVPLYPDFKMCICFLHDFIFVVSVTRKPCTVDFLILGPELKIAKLRQSGDFPVEYMYYRALSPWSLPASRGGSFTSGRTVLKVSLSSFSPTTTSDALSKRKKKKKTGNGGTM